MTWTTILACCRAAPPTSATWRATRRVVALRSGGRAVTRTLILARAGSLPAAGATVGVGAAGDWLGYEPEMMLVTVGFPLWAGHEAAADDPVRPQLVLTWGQTF